MDDWEEEMDTKPDPERDAARREAITDAEVRQLVHALAPFGILDHDALSRACDHHGWHDDGFDSALHKAVDSGVIEKLPGGFYKLVDR